MGDKVKLSVAGAIKMIAVARVFVGLIHGVAWTQSDASHVSAALGKTERIAAAVAAVELALSELESGD